MQFVLKENETMKDLVARLVSSSEIVAGIAPLAYWYENLHENGRIADIHFSNKMREMLGYKSVEEFPDELNTLMTFIHPDDVHIMLENAIAAGTGKIGEYNVEYRIRNATGGYTWCNATGQVVKNHQGVTVGMYGAFIDITGKKSIDENAIINSFADEYDAAFLGNLSDRTYTVISNKDRVVEQISGLAHLDDALKMYVKQFVHPDDVSHFEDYLLSAETVKEKVGVGQSASFEFRSSTEGDFQWCRALVRRLNENDVLIGFKNCNPEVIDRLAHEKLLGGYDAIYFVNLDRNEIQSVRSSRVSSVGAFSGVLAYDATLKRFAETVAPKYRQDWINFSNPAAMKQYLSSEDHREFVYELPGTDKTMRRFTADVLERNGGEAEKVLFSFIGIDDLRAKTILLNQKIAEQASFTDFFLSTYISAYYIDFINKSCQIYKRTDRLEREYPIIADYFDSVKEYIERDVHPDDRAELLDKIAPERMRAILKERAEYTHVFRDISDGKEKLYRIQVIRGADADHAAFGFKDVTDETAKENEMQRHLAIEQNSQRIMALEDDLESLYDVELDSGKYAEYTKGDFYRQNVTEKLLREGDFFKDIQENIETVIYPDDRGMLKEAMQRESIRKALSETDRVEYYYRLSVGGKPLWLKIRIVYKSADRKSVIIGCFRAEEEMAEKRRNEDLVNTFSKQYSAVYYGNLEDGSYQILVRKENVVSIIGGTTTICEAIRAFTEKTVHPDDRHLFAKDFYSIESIRAKLDVGESCTFEYRSDNYGEYRWFRADFRRTNEQDLLVGFKDCDDEVLERIEHERLQKDMEVQHALSDGLAREYHTVWLVDGFGEHRLHLYRSTGAKTVKRAVQRGLDEPTYDGTMVKYVMDSVHEDDRERVLEASRFETVRRETPDIGTYVVSYKRYCDDKGNVDYHQMCFAKAVADDGTVNYILAFRDADKMLREQIAMRDQLKEALEKANYEAERTNFVLSFSGASRWSYYINSDDEVVSANYSSRIETTVIDKDQDPMAWLNLIHPDDRERVLENFMAAIHDHSGQTPYDVTYRVLEKDGKYYWGKSMGRILRHEDGSEEMFGMSMDITKQVEEQERQQNQLKDALEMAQSANRAKTTFLNNMSHDIRTPMNAIIGYTGLAASHIDNKAQVLDYLTKIGQSSDHLLSLINDVLDMSRIESGKMNLDEKEEYLPDIIHTLRDIIHSDIRSKRHDFFIDTENVNDEHIICDKLRLNQVLLNILSNAIKYTAAGGIISMRITEKTVKKSGYATYEFCVKDNGMGMDKDFIETIFDPFTRVKSSTVSGIQGTGLGMAITKNIIDMMGGKIDVRSELGKGTEITVTFDFKLANAPKEVIVIPELSGVKGLVADDDSNTCLSIAKMLKDVGMRSEWCTSGKEAVIRAEAAYHDGDLFKVYIIDWLMPDMNGIETTRRIRKVIGDDVPIIILTAYDWSDIEDEAREAGVTEFVSKPMFPSDLHRVLTKCLGKEESTKKKETVSFDLNGKKVLLVEDNALNREIATAILEEYGCTVFSAEDGDIAVDMMKKASAGDYDIVLMDVQMPTLNGYEATRQIRALGTEISRIPILAMTANAFEEDRQLALDAGMNEHIAKPIDIEKLKATLAQFMK